MRRVVQRGGGAAWHSQTRVVVNRGLTGPLPVFPSDTDGP